MARRRKDTNPLTWPVVRSDCLNIIEQPDGLRIGYFDTEPTPDQLQAARRYFGALRCEYHISSVGLDDLVVAVFEEEPPVERKVLMCRRLLGEERWADTIEGMREFYANAPAMVAGAGGL